MIFTLRLQQGCLLTSVRYNKHALSGLTVRDHLLHRYHHGELSPDKVIFQNCAGTMSNQTTLVEDLICVLCRTPFGIDPDRLPFAQVCHHSICQTCNKTGEKLHRCPADGMPIRVRSTKPNRPLIIFLGGKKTHGDHLDPLIELAEFARDNSYASLSPQLSKRLIGLIASSHEHSERFIDFLRKIESFFHRLLVELIQAHYNTKRREQDVRKLICKSGCSIEHPALTDAVVEALIRLYDVTHDEIDTSYERSVLIRFLSNELGEQNRNQLEKILQTFYRSSCFYITPGVDAPCRLRLKENIRSPYQLRQQHDAEMIKLAQSKGIRLSPESWAYLLHGRSSLDHISRIQSLLDKQRMTPTVGELRAAILEMGDQHRIQEYLGDLEDIEVRMIAMMGRQDPKQGEVVEVLRLLARLKHLFVIRQLRRNDTSDSASSRV